MGEPEQQIPQLTDEEYRARLIQIGKDAHVPDCHTVWVVENPSANFPFFKDRSDVDNICYAMPVQHFELFPSNTLTMQIANTTFYHFRDREAALEDAAGRLAKIGRRCRFCHGVAHPASGSQYTPTFIVCGTCIRPHMDVMKKVPKAGLGAYLENWTASKSSKKLKERFPDAKGFYESAALFMGQDHRKVNV